MDFTTAATNGDLPPDVTVDGLLQHMRQLEEKLFPHAVDVLILDAAAFEALRRHPDFDVVAKIPGPAGVFGLRFEVYPTAHEAEYRHHDLLQKGVKSKLFVAGGELEMPPVEPHWKEPL